MVLKCDGMLKNKNVNSKVLNYLKEISMDNKFVSKNEFIYDFKNNWNLSYLLVC